MRQFKSFACGLELVLWALCLGALWMLALWVAPSLFKWLPRPEAGLVAGRLFYMMSWCCGLVALLLPLLAIANQAMVVGVGQGMRSLRWPLLALLLVLLVVVVELGYIHPHMRSLRQAMAEAGPELVPALKAQFSSMHAFSTTVYAVKMVAMLVWGLLRYAPRVRVH